MRADPPLDRFPDGARSAPAKLRPRRRLLSLDSQIKESIRFLNRVSQVRFLPRALPEPAGQRRFPRNRRGSPNRGDRLWGRTGPHQDSSAALGRLPPGVCSRFGCGGGARGATRGSRCPHDVSGSGALRAGSGVPCALDGFIGSAVRLLNGRSPHLHLARNGRCRLPVQDRDGTVTYTVTRRSSTTGINCAPSPVATWGIHHLHGPGHRQLGRGTRIAPAGTVRADIEEGADWRVASRSASRLLRSSKIPIRSDLTASSKHARLDVPHRSMSTPRALAQRWSYPYPARSAHPTIRPARPGDRPSPGDRCRSRSMPDRNPGRRRSPRR